MQRSLRRIKQQWKGRGEKEKTDRGRKKREGGAGRKRRRGGAGRKKRRVGGRKRTQIKDEEERRRSEAARPEDEVVRSEDLTRRSNFEYAMPNAYQIKYLIDFITPPDPKAENAGEMEKEKKEGKEEEKEESGRSNPEITPSDELDQETENSSAEIKEGEEEERKEGRQSKSDRTDDQSDKKDLSNWTEPGTSLSPEEALWAAGLSNMEENPEEKKKKEKKDKKRKEPSYPTFEVKAKERQRRRGGMRPQRGVRKKIWAYKFRQKRRWWPCPLVRNR